MKSRYWCIHHTTVNVRFRNLLFVPFLAALVLSPCWAFADWSPVINRLVADGFDESTVRTLFSRAEVSFEPSPMSNKLKELIENVSKLPSDNPKAVYQCYLKENVITQAHSYLQENTELLENIHNKYFVPKEIIVSILLVESRLGESVGGMRAFNTLASMVRSTDLETIRPYLPKKLITPRNEDFARTICRQKADWAYVELKALILYAHQSEFDPLTFPGSIYGAIGLCQFMPSNILPYGVDADHDGRIDLFTKADAFYSIANYLREHGWRDTMDKGGQREVILRYNRSSIYANTVLAVAQRLKNRSQNKQPSLKESLAPL
ncbi:MAG TPA: lytic murein transglycosylase [Thermodesulfobacteriota bacterium]|nr:lytic murein transglycosylase [Thermodesulfobacteriota bacterium]